MSDKYASRISSLLRIVGPKLQDVDEPFHDCGLRFGDRGVDVRHAGPFARSCALES